MTRGIANEYSGVRFGNLIALSRVGRDLTNNSLWSCKCDCGNEVTVRAHLLKKAKYCSKQCALLREKQVNDIRGKRFGRLVAIQPIKSDSYGKAKWLCQCDCGNTLETTGDRMRTGLTTSCGCAKVKHGRSKTREYHVERYAAYMEAKRRATPIKLMDERIVKLYEQARQLTKETGIPHEVDHVLPLQGKTVSGLHIYENLQVVTREVNRRKSSSFRL